MERKKKKKATHTHKSCIMVFTCATPPRLLGRNSPDHVGMFPFDLTVKKIKKKKKKGR